MKILSVFFQDYKICLIDNCLVFKNELADNQLILFFVPSMSNEQKCYIHSYS